MSMPPPLRAVIPFYGRESYRFHFLSPPWSHKAYIASSALKPSLVHAIALGAIGYRGNVFPGLTGLFMLSRLLPRLALVGVANSELNN